MPPQGEADRRPRTPPHPLASHTHNSRKAPTSYNDVSASLIMRLPSFETFAPEGTSCSACLVRPLALHEAPPPSCLQSGLGCQPPRHLFMASLPSPRDRLSGLININGRAGSRVAPLGDSLSGRRVRVPSQLQRDTPA